MKEETELVVLPEIKYAVSVDEIKEFVSENKELETLDPTIGLNDEAYLLSKKTHIRAVTLRTGIEKKRKEIVAPALAFTKQANSIAKEYTALLADTETRLFTQRSTVEQYEKDKELKRINDENDRVRALDEEIGKLRMIPSDSIGLTSEALTTIYSAIEMPDPTVFKEKLDLAIDTYKDTMLKLESMIETTKQAEEVEQVRAEEEAKRKEAQALADAKAKQEREDFEKEKAEFQREKDEAQRVKNEVAEVEALRVAEEVAEAYAKEQEEAKVRSVKAKDDEIMKIESETVKLLEDIIQNKYDSTPKYIAEAILSSIKCDEIPYLEFTL